MSISWYAHYLGDYARDTAHLSMMEHGAYRLLLDHYYSTGLPLPADAKQLLRICRAFDEAEGVAIESVLHHFFELREDGWHNARADREIAKFKEISEKRAKAGAKGGAKAKQVKQQKPKQKGKQLPEQLPTQPQPHSFSEGVSPLLSGNEGDVTTPPKDNPSQTKALDERSPTAITWDRYAQAFEQRYSVKPVRNAQTNGQLANLVARLGKDDAPEVAEFYVKHNHRLYVAATHTVTLLLRDAESLRTQWARNQCVTSIEAAQTERTQANSNAFAPMLAEAQQRERIANG